MLLERRELTCGIDYRDFGSQGSKGYYVEVFDLEDYLVVFVSIINILKK
jgi:hypothetical protein